MSAQNLLGFASWLLLLRMLLLLSTDVLDQDEMMVGWLGLEDVELG